MAVPVRAHRVVLAAAFLGIVSAAVQLSAPRSALASDGYNEDVTTTYTVNPGAGRLDVALDVAFKNTSPNTSAGVYYYFAVYVWLEHGATNVAATTNEGGASVARDKAGSGFDRWVVRLDRYIYYGATRRIHVTYRLAGGAPRSSSDIRVNPAFASFCVVAQGDDGGVTRVVVPRGFQLGVDGEGGSLFPSTGPTTTTWSTGPLADAYRFWACLNGANPAGYTDTLATSPGGQTIDIQAWPTDSRWQSQVDTEVERALPKVEVLVGRALPGTGPITVREVAEGEISGYAGVYDPSTGIALVGEDYGAGGTVTHELSHAWFNDNLFADRWMSEGLAEWARISIVPDVCLDPGQPSGGGSAHLATWVFAGPRSTDSEIKAVDYEYEAACYVVNTLAAKVGPERMRVVLATMFDHKLAYRSGSTVLDGKPGSETWRQWLDAFDELGLVPAGASDLDSAQTLLATFGAVSAGPELDSRSKARAAYHALSASIGDWTLPEAVLRPMAEWQFADATVAMDDISKAYDSLVAADASLAGIDAVGGSVKGVVEAARTETELAAAAKMAADEEAAAAVVANAEHQLDAPRDALTQIGLIGADPGVSLPAAVAAAASGDLGAATDQAALITGTLAGASQQGLTRLVMAVAAMLLTLLIVIVVIRRRRRTAARRALLLAAAAPGAEAALTMTEPLTTDPSPTTLPPLTTDAPVAADVPLIADVPPATGTSPEVSQLPPHEDPSTPGT